MEDIKIKIKSKLINYDLNFEHNLNILRGDSATGKSMFIRLLDKRRTSKIDVKSNYELVHLTSEILNLGIELSEKTVYIMDENNGIENQIIIDTINKNKYKFIIIARDIELENLHYGTENIYELYKSGKCNLNRRLYNNNLDKNQIKWSENNVKNLLW